MTEDEIKEFEKWHRDESNMVSGLTPVPNSTLDNYKIIYWETEHRFGEYRKKIIWIKSYEEAKEAQISPSKNTRAIERAKLKRYEEALNNIRDYQFHILCDGAEHEIACCNIAKKALEQQE